MDDVSKIPSSLYTAKLFKGSFLLGVRVVFANVRCALF